MSYEQQAAKNKGNPFRVHYQQELVTQKFGERGKLFRKGSALEVKHTVAVVLLYQGSQ